MFPAIHHRRLWSPLRLSPHELDALRGAAERLRGPAGAHAGSLRVHHLAVICDAPRPALRAVTRAVSEAGGAVTLLHADAWRAKPPAALRDAARVLGRLYDAIDCCDLPQSVAEQIDREAGVPVFDGLAGGTHPLQLLADAMTLQAILPAPTHELRITVDAHGHEELREALACCAASTGLRLAEVPALASGTPDEPDVELDLALPLSPDRLRLPNGAPALQARLTSLLADHEAALLQAAYMSALA